MLRLPAVAGRFYNGSEVGLRDDIARTLPDQCTPIPAIAAIAPHAGVMYSGPVAGAVYADLVLPQTVILIGPNHTGQGPPISIFPEGRWIIPGAEVLVDHRLTAELLRRFSPARADILAHQYEHCLELQLPFLAYAGPMASSPRVVQIVPVVLGTTDPGVCRRFGLALAELVRACITASEARPLLIASTDMNHYESDAQTRFKDRLAIEAIEALDADLLYQRSQQHHISMCGLGAVLTVLAAARSLGAAAASLKRYDTSAAASGDQERVVGYAGFVIPDTNASVV